MEKNHPNLCVCLLISGVLRDEGDRLEATFTEEMVVIRTGEGSKAKNGLECF